MPLPTIKRPESLAGLKLEKVLGRKNPYLFKAKYIETAGDLLKRTEDGAIDWQSIAAFNSAKARPAKQPRIN